MLTEKNKVKNIGLNVKPPDTDCNDKNCPFHGTLSIRGQVLEGTVVSSKMQGSISVQRDFMHYVKKFERYEKKTSKYNVHCPPCIKLNVGDKIRIAECRPLSKTVSFVTIEKL